MGFPIVNITSSVKEKKYKKIADEMEKTFAELSVY